MKVKELIEKLQQFDPELTVTFPDSEDGEQVVTDVDICEDTWVSWDKATTLHLYGDYIEKSHIDPKYFKPQERPVYKPNLILDNLKTVYDSAVPRGTVFFVDKPPLNKDGNVEFKIINKRDMK